MQVFIVTLGTRGDFEQFLTLARELQTRGHQALLGTSPFYGADAADANIDWTPLGAGSRSDLVGVLRSLAPVHDKTQRTYLYYDRWLRPQLEMSLPKITALAAGTDYFVSNLKLVLRRDGKILAGAAVSYDPPGNVSDLPQYGTQQHDGRILDIVAMSKTLIDPQNLWGKEYHFTGFWKPSMNTWSVVRSPWSVANGNDCYGPRTTDYGPISAFLDQGPPPVIVTLGSMVMFDTGKLVADITEALRLAGQRGILVAGWSEIDGEMSGSIMRTNDISYKWLFPRGCCVVHHGGCGTVAAVLRAGVPSILLPQVTCQEHFGKILMRESLATGMFDVHGLDVRRLASAIDKAARDGPVRQHARVWQRALAEEPGVKAAADLIEAHWHAIQ
jgi:UDP:flavonoid glycosyltransferase YjiC (YdhE family)